MASQPIDMPRAVSLRDSGALFVDARSPAEFAEATIPGAINVPLLDNEERARVGTVYKERGPAEARRLGVELVAPRIPRMIEQVAAVRGESRQPAVVFCWRGGMRSRALTSFLELAGIPARQLKGGHKAFRAYLRDFFERGEWGRLLVLRGLTGVGKTRLLLRLRDEGCPVLDLEGLAGHRGSAFGALGLPPQPAQKVFEAHLWDALRRIPPDSYALTEGESRHIGRLGLPERVHQSLQSEVSLWIEASLEQRVRNILEEYPAREEQKDAFVKPIESLRRRLGNAAVEGLLQLLAASRWEELTRELMVLYYDPLYRHTLPERRVEIDIEPEEEGIRRLKAAIRKVFIAER